MTRISNPVVEILKAKFLNQFHESTRLWVFRDSPRLRSGRIHLRLEFYS